MVIQNTHIIKKKKKKKEIHLTLFLFENYQKRSSLNLRKQAQDKKIAQTSKPYNKNTAQKINSEDRVPGPQPTETARPHLARHERATPLAFLGI